MSPAGVSTWNATTGQEFAEFFTPSPCWLQSSSSLSWEYNRRELYPRMLRLPNFPRAALSIFSLY